MVTLGFLDHVLRWQEVGDEFDFEHLSLEGPLKLPRSESLSRQLNV